MQELNTEIFEKIAELLSLFGDTTRIRIMSELLHTELCVGEIAERLNMTTSAISHQLRILKQGRLVKSRKEGKTVFYALADSHVGSIFSLALEHVQE
ncbi:MAG: metalloregulator ArsR/SmtB family transcription factor [Oscillospiraceae bacterium]|nr:metalloregulator ArsR/SmtB family transcription factor [Oscillospiraceae bacterium]